MSGSGVAALEIHWRDVAPRQLHPGAWDPPLELPAWVRHLRGLNLFQEYLDGAGTLEEDAVTTLGKSWEAGGWVSDASAGLWRGPGVRWGPHWHWRRRSNTLFSGEEADQPPESGGGRLHRIPEMGFAPEEFASGTRLRHSLQSLINRLYDTSMDGSHRVRA